MHAQLCYSDALSNGILTDCALMFIFFFSKMLTPLIESKRISGALVIAVASGKNRYTPAGIKCERGLCVDLPSWLVFLSCVVF